jgi:SP family xylose:H+ symportor-like MFS transporter
MFAIGLLAFMKIIGISTLVFIIIYTASFMMSWGPICWVLISELFPNKIRGKAVAVAVAAQWAANYFISSTYPAMMEFSSGGTYWFYGAMSILSLFGKWFPKPKEKRWKKWSICGKNKKAPSSR